MAIVRGRLVGVVLAACSAVVLSTCPSASAAGVSSPWEQTAGNAALDRANLTEKTLTTSNVKYLKLQRLVKSPAWPPGGDDHCVNGVSAPVLSGGFVYAVIRDKLTKINAATGVVQWAVPATGTEDEYVLADLAVVNGVVVIDSLYCRSESDPGRDIRAVDAATGALRWDGSIDGSGNAVVSGGYVVAIGWTIAGTSIEVLNLETGAVKWSKSPDCDQEATIAVVHGLVTYNTCDNAANLVEADRLATGARVWSQPGGLVQAGDTDSSSGYNLFTSTDNGVIDRNPANGKPRFSLAGATKVLAVGKSYVFATCSADQTKVCGYSMITGALRWSRTGTAAIRNAVLANGVLYLDSGAVLKYNTGGRLTTVPAAESDYLPGSVAVGDGRLAILLPPSGDNAPSNLGLYGLPSS